MLVNRSLWPNRNPSATWIYHLKSLLEIIVCKGWLSVQWVNVETDETFEIRYWSDQTWPWPAAPGELQLSCYPTMYDRRRIRKNKDTENNRILIWSRNRGALYRREPVYLGGFGLLGAVTPWTFERRESEVIWRRRIVDTGRPKLAGDLTAFSELVSRLTIQQS